MRIPHCAAPQGSARPSAPYANCWVSGPRSCCILCLSSKQSTIFRLLVPHHPSHFWNNAPPPSPPLLCLLGFQPNTAGTQLSFSNLALHLKHRVTNQGKESDISSGTFPESGDTLCSRDQLTRRPCRERPLPRQRLVI